jgi:pullulanase/glycogen debranching enzyme
MKFCPVVPEICRGQVHASRKERIRIIKIIIRNGAKTISLLNFVCHENWTLHDIVFQYCDLVIG